MTVPDTEDAEKKVMQATEYHLMPTSQVRQGLDGIVYRTYKLLRGSSTYDTSEMARENDADEVHQTRRKPAEEYRLGTKNSKANSQELQHGGRHR